MSENLKKPVKIIFDTDIGGDCDDAGALAMLHRLCDKGEAELLAVTHCFSTPYVAGCIDAINQFYGRVVPVGVNYEIRHEGRGTYAGALSEYCPNRYPPETFGTDKAAPDTLEVLRKTLAAEEDGSVTLVVTGMLHSMAKLLRSGADDISPLTGKELAAKKICRTVVMGGRFFESWPMIIYPDGNENGTPVTWEWNIHGSGYEDAHLVAEEWPGELVYSSYEIGSYITTMAGFLSRARKGDPVALAYELHNHGAGRCSWDLTAMLDAVRPGKYWHYHAFGKVAIGEDLVTRWEKNDETRHTYLLPKADYEDIRKVMDDLIDGK